MHEPLFEGDRFKGFTLSDRVCRGQPCALVHGTPGAGYESGGEQACWPRVDCRAFGSGSYMDGWHVHARCLCVWQAWCSSPLRACLQGEDLCGRRSSACPRSHLNFLSCCSHLQLSSYLGEVEGSPTTLRLVKKKVSAASSRQWSASFGLCLLSHKNMRQYPLVE